MSLASVAAELRQLRLAATLVAVLPDAVVEIGDPPAPTCGAALRAAIATALSDRDSDVVRSILGLGPSAPVRVVPGPGTRELGGGVYEVLGGAAVQVLFATVLPPCHAKVSVVAVADVEPPPHLAVEVDPCTAVALVVASGAPHPSAQRRLGDFAIAAAGACIADELILGL